MSQLMVHPQPTKKMKQDNSVTDIVRKTAKATGCSEKSVFIFRKEEATTGTFREPKKVKIRTGVNTNSRSVKYDNTVREAIRNTVYDLKHRNIVPSLKTISKEVNANPQLPTFSRMTLRRLLFDMGFYYEKNGNKSVLVEKSLDEINSENVPVKKKKKSVKKSPKNKVELNPIDHLSINLKVESRKNVNDYQPAVNEFLPQNNCTFQNPMIFNPNVIHPPSIHNSINHLHVPSNSGCAIENKVLPSHMTQQVCSQVWMYH